MIIVFETVRKQFSGDRNQFTALDSIDLTIEDHEIFGVIGESGAGKSTLLRLINSLEVPDGGQVLIDDIAIGSLSASELRKQRQEIGMIFQQFNLLNNKTVEENVRLPLKLLQNNDWKEVDDVLAFVNLTAKRNNYPGQLSGGEKQRVAIARALVTRPKILLCDEPTSSLDENTTQEILSVLRNVHDTYHTTIVIVTHELNVVKSLCNRAAILQNGKLLDVLTISNSETDETSRSYYQRALEVLG